MLYLADNLKCRTSRLKLNFPGKKQPFEHLKELQKIADEALDTKKINIQYRLFKALADKTRLKILHLLAVKPLCVCEVMAALKLTQPTASHHLRILESAGIIREERQGRWIFYHVNKSEIIAVVERLSFL